MNQRQRLENIIIGTLLDVADHYDDCQSCITAEIFLDDRNRRIYEMVTEMRSEGMVKTDPHSIFQRYGEKVADLIPYMCEVCTEFSFEWQKAKYNERVYLTNFKEGLNIQPTGVEFGDYVNQFLKIVLKDEKTANNRCEQPTSFATRHRDGTGGALYPNAL